jgi:DNA gyrase subunit A
MNIDDDDEIVGMQHSTQGEALLLVSEYGLGKRTRLSEFTRQRRGGKGLKCYKITEKSGNIVGFKAVNEDNEIMLITNQGIVIRTGCDEISMLGRNTTGVKLINIDVENNVRVASISKVRQKSAEESETLVKSEDDSYDTDADSDDVVIDADSETDGSDGVSDGKGDE